MAVIYLMVCINIIIVFIIVNTMKIFKIVKLNKFNNQKNADSVVNGNNKNLNFDDAININGNPIREKRR